MSTRLTVNQLEQMKTHELADLLANVVLLLRRMPDVACGQLVQQMPSISTIHALPEQMQTSTPIPAMSREDLQKKTVADLRKIANELHLPLSSKMKKEELVSKILARSSDRHSEQFAIHEM
ncbi:MAG TPA: Rho termination factor N-terminal domain-containing protein [Ktedonobacteraceae bacterium]|nr:Rho termination factor N-terminal domain-containing protein [Ktedonobacteraceae bacterium]